MLPVWLISELEGLVLKNIMCACPLCDLYQNSKDWERVAAVIVQGAKWQFKDWIFKVRMAVSDIEQCDLMCVSVVVCLSVLVCACMCVCLCVRLCVNVEVRMVAGDIEQWP